MVKGLWIYVFREKAIFRLLLCAREIFEIRTQTANKDGIVHACSDNISMFWETSRGNVSKVFVSKTWFWNTEGVRV